MQVLVFTTLGSTMSTYVYLCYLCLAKMVLTQGIAGVTGSGGKTPLSQAAESQIDKKASSLKYIGLGKRTLPQKQELADALSSVTEKRARDAYRYASLGKREADDIYDYLTKRSGAFKYGSLGKRTDQLTQESGQGFVSDKRGSSAFKYGSLGKRGNSAFRNSGVGKRGGNAFRYGSLGKRDTMQDNMGTVLMGDQLPEYQLQHSVDKRSASEHDILAKRLGYAYKYASVGKRVPTSSDGEIYKRWSSTGNASPHRSLPAPLQRRGTTFRYIGVGKRDGNRGIKYASLGKRQGQWKYAGLGKRAVSEDNLDSLLESLMEQRENLMEQLDQSYEGEEGEPLSSMDASDWPSWQ